MKTDKRATLTRTKLINSILAKSIKKYGKGSTILLSDKSIKSNVTKTISTCSPRLDRILAKDTSGNFGMPVGRIIGVSGLEASGKTTLAIMVMRSTQQMGGIARLIETEHAFDPSYAARLGLNLDELLLSQPDYLEQGLDMIDEDCNQFKAARDEYMKETGEEWDVPMTIILDSIAGAPAKAEFEAGSFVDNQARALHARQLSKFFRIIAGVISKEEICLICTNQLKTDTEVRFGNKDAEIGGRALKFHATLRLDMRRSGYIKETKDGDATGIITNVKTVKNKVMVPFKTVKVPIVFGEGISYGMSLFDALMDKEIIQQEGSKYTLEYPKNDGKIVTVTAKGKNKFMEELKLVTQKEPTRRKIERLLDED